MNQVIKLNSDNAGSFNSAQNIVNFTIPAGVWNLRDSYININAVITTADPDPSTGEGIFPVALRLKNDIKAKVPNTVIIRDARISCDGKGVIEDISRVDQLRNLLHNFSHSIDETESENYIDMNIFSSKVNGLQNNSSIFRDIVKLGNQAVTPSRDLTISPVSIRLGDIWDFCNATEWDTNRAGNGRLRVRLNLDEIEPYHQASTQIDDIYNMNGVSAVAVNNQLVSAQKITALDQSPYHLGQKCYLTADGATSGGTAPIDISQSVLIKTINWDRVATSSTFGKLVITFEEDWGVATPDGSYINIALQPRSPNGISVDFNYAEIVLKEAQDTQQDQISYNTYNVEQNNGNELENYSNVFQLEPECTNVAVVMCEGGSNILSNNVGFSSYNIRLNNEDLVDNRTVDYMDSLYRDRLNMTMGNMDNRLNNFTSHTGDTHKQADRYTNTALKIGTIMNPIVPSSNTQLLQLNINSYMSGTSGLRSFSLFKELPRIFSY